MEQETREMKEKEAGARLNKAFEESDIAYFGYLKNVTTIATGLLALLVSLKSNKGISPWSKYLFLATISCLAFGIVLSMITQYKEVHTSKENLRQLSRSFRNKDHEKIFLELVNTSTNTYEAPTKFFAWTEILAYIMLGLAFIMLIAYVFVVELT